MSGEPEATSRANAADRAARELRLPGDGVTLHALAWGAGEDLLLAVHATSFCAEVWQPVWDALPPDVAAGWRLVAVDQRGHGRSDAPPEPDAYGWTKLARDVVAAARALRERHPGARVVGLGHSSGATATLAAAGSEPGLFAALLAVEPVLFEPPPPGADADSFAGSRALAERSRRRRDAFESREAARQVLARRFPYSGFDAAALEAYLDGGFVPGTEGTLRLRCRPEVEAWAYAGAAALDLWPLAPRIEAPLALVLGEHSAVPAPLEERLRALAPVVVAVRVPGATHFAVLERPAEVSSALADLLRRVAGR